MLGEMSQRYPPDRQVLPPDTDLDEAEPTTSSGRSRRDVRPSTRALQNLGGTDPDLTLRRILRRDAPADRTPSPEARKRLRTENRALKRDTPVDRSPSPEERKRQRIACVNLVRSFCNNNVNSIS